MHASRRQFLRSSVMASGGAAFLAATSTKAAHRREAVHAADPHDESHFGVARRVIFAVSDGMSVGTLTLADLYDKTVMGSEGTEWVRLLGAPDARNAMCSTHCSDSLVTDSAAASTAWSCGRKVYRGSIGFNDDREPERPILLRARDAGFRTGLVTTSSVTDATPAGFIANVPRRTMEREIAQQILDRAPEVVLGGGRMHFEAASVDAFRGRFTDTLVGLGEAHDARSEIGVLAEGHMPYVLDRSAEDTGLEDMTRHAISRLDSAGDGFLMQVEAARVDHAAHRNDAASMVLEQLEFDRTLRRLVRYTESRDDTLLIITTDHGNANPGLTVYGERGERGLESLANARRSFDWIIAELRSRDPGMSKTAVVREVIEYATGIALNEDDLARLAGASTPRANLFGEMDSFTSRLGSLLANHNGIGFVSKNHTADLVHVSALGAGAGLLRP
ncbi:MAG: alkaline phosphatase, partial [Planctomycetota bacterium]